MSDIISPFRVFLNQFFDSIFVRFSMGKSPGHCVLDKRHRKRVVLAIKFGKSQIGCKISYDFVCSIFDLVFFLLQLSIKNHLFSLMMTIIIMIIIVISVCNHWFCVNVDWRKGILWAKERKTVSFSMWRFSKADHKVIGTDIKEETKRNRESNERNARENVCVHKHWTWWVWAQMFSAFGTKEPKKRIIKIEVMLKWLKLVQIIWYCGEIWDWIG